VGGFGVVDTITWEALGLALTIVGLLVSAVVWRRRGPTSGIRAVAWSLLPLALGLTGTLQLLWRIGSLIGGWAVHVVFSPVVWLGIALAGAALVLLVVTGVLRAKGVGRRSPRDAAVEQKPAPGVPAKSAARPADPGADDDMADVEAILKRHGIS
jgi:heme exporter protein D